MTATLITGPRTWEGSRNEEGNRTWDLVHLVETDDPLDGPAIVMETPGLPAIGAQYLVDNDVDIWAFCSPQRTVKGHQHKEGDHIKIWRVKSKFTTLPFKRCRDTTIEDPLLEPDKVSGSFVKYTQEAIRDRFGNYIVNSSHEIIRGPQVEFDFNRAVVHIEQNVPNLELEIFTPMVDKVNSVPMWGLGTRRVKLSDPTWERKYHGSCSIYYTRIFNFDIDFRTFDRTVIDEGTKVLDGAWDISVDPPVWDTTKGLIAAPDRNNPSHFIKFTDLKDNPIRVILNGAGEPATDFLLDTDTGTGAGGNNPGNIDIEYYDETDFFVLGIPTTL